MKKAGARKSLQFFKDNLTMIRSLEAKDEEGCSEKCLNILQRYVDSCESEEAPQQPMRELNRVALHQVTNHLLDELDKCNTARINAIKEDKIASEIAMWTDMQYIYGLLLQQLKGV